MTGRAASPTRRCVRLSIAAVLITLTTFTIAIAYAQGRPPSNHATTVSHHQVLARPIDAGVEAGSAHGSSTIGRENSLVGDGVKTDPASKLLDGNKDDRDPGMDPAPLAAQRTDTGRSDDTRWPPRFVHSAVVELTSDRGVLCSGVLIKKNYVLTAAHCRGAKAAVFQTSLNEPPTSIRITHFEVPTGRGVDLGVARLAQDASVISYRMRDAADARAPESTVRLVGFGVTDERTLTGAGVRRWADIPIAGWGCDERSAARTGCIEDLEMVLRASNGLDTCAGDSGGPVLEFIGGAPRVVGITSRGVESTSVRCGAGGIYVRVDRMRGWIDEATKK